MEQILCHLVGDYVLQTNWMARNKSKKSTAAIMHALFYVLPFVLLTQSPAALLIIFFTHLLIDRFSLALHLIRFRNWTWTENGFPPETPNYLSHLITMIVDNTIHLIINFFTLKYLG
jgi:hypothetical protein